MTTAWNPTWWNKEQHESGWGRVKDALKRDWEQTLSDVGVKGKKDLNQDVDDTVKQAVGKDAIPPAGRANVPGGTPENPKANQWSDVETPIKYGFGARQQFGKDHPEWNSSLEGKLKGEWDESKIGQKWDDVKTAVKHGYDRARN